MRFNKEYRAISDWKLGFIVRNDCDISLFCLALKIGLASIPEQTFTVRRPAQYITVPVLAEYITVSTGTVHHCVSTGTVHHCASTGTVHHRVSTGTVHHCVSTGTVHHCASTGTSVTQTHSSRSCGRNTKVYISSRTAGDLFPGEISLFQCSD